MNQHPRDEADDQELVKDAQADLRHLVHLYDRYVDAVYRYISSRVDDRQTAEDLTSQIFVRVIEHLHDYRPTGSFAAWLFTIARNTLFSHYRQRRPMLRYEDTRDSPRENYGFNRIEQVEQLEQLEECLGQLDQDERELLFLRFAADLTYPEIGQVLGRSEGAVKMATHRLLQRLQEAMERMA